VTESRKIKKKNASVWNDASSAAIWSTNCQVKVHVCQGKGKHSINASHRPMEMSCFSSQQHIYQFSANYNATCSDKMLHMQQITAQTTSLSYELMPAINKTKKC
jgi:hypothetical protein